MNAPEPAPASGRGLDPVASLDLQRTSTVDQVVEALRHAILDGRLAPGVALREISLADGLGVSRGTVREALRVLTAESLVTHQAHRGATVAQLDQADAADAYLARLPIECAAAEHVARTGDGLDALRAAVDEMAVAAEAGDVADLVEAHASFHVALVATLGSRRLRRFFSSVQSELRLSLATVERMTGAMAETLADHRELLDQLVGGDPEACRAAVIDHLGHGAADVADLPEL